MRSWREGQISGNDRARSLVRFAAPLMAALTTLSQPLCARADKVDDYIRGEMDKHHIPGVALGVMRGGKIVKSASYGFANLELHVPVRSNTVFEIGSITKQFTAAGILLLAEQGKLSLDDRISTHLHHTPAAWANITIGNLLTHTSGIHNYTGLDGFALTKHLTQDQFLDAIGSRPLDFAPGESWKYSNSGFNLLGFIIENTTGTNYWTWMSNRIFAPLGMQATGDRRPSSIIPNRASGYEQTNHAWINRDYDLTDVFSAGAIVSTVGDMLKWSRALDSDQLLSAESKTQMWTPTKLNDGKATKYGLGWFLDTLDGHRNVGHSGSTSGFSASIQRFPDDHLAIVVLTNTDEQIATTLATNIARLYFKRVRR